MNASAAQASEHTTRDAHGASRSIEAILLTMDRPVSAQALGAALDIDQTQVAGLIDALNETYDEAGLSFRIEPVAGGFRLMTRSEYAGAVGAFHQARASSTLSRAALETLAIIAYRQPVTRARLEAIRGVSSGEVLRTLIDRRLVTMTGRAEELGRPMLYGTTREFLSAFGLASIKDLPSIDSEGGQDARPTGFRGGQDADPTGA